MKRQKSTGLAKNKFKHKYNNNKNYCKVRDLCHYAAKYSGSAHIKSNLEYRKSKQIPVVFHKGSNYN